MKQVFKKCALLLAIGAMSLSLNAQHAGDDLTSSFVNPAFADGTNGWTVAESANWTVTTSSGKYGFTGTYLEATSAKKFSGFSVSQMAGMPFGDYEVSAVLYRQEGSNYNKGDFFLIANGEKKNSGNSSANGGAKTTVKTRVCDSTLTITFGSNQNRNNTLAVGDLKITYTGFPNMFDLVDKAKTYADKKMLDAYSNRYYKVLARAEVAAPILNAEYMNICTELEALNAVAQGSIDDFAAYKATIDKAMDFVAASSKADKHVIDSIIDVHVNQYTAGEKSPKAEKWIAALELALGEFDASYFITNSSFTDSLNAWTLDTIAKNANPIVVEFVTGQKGISSAIYLHNTKNDKQAFKSVSLTNTVSGLPNGDYYLSAKAWKNEGGNYGKGTVTLYANDKSAKFGNSSADAAGSAKVKVRVSDGTLVIKVLENDGRNGELMFGDFTLDYVGFESWAKVSGSTATASCVEEFIDALKSDKYDSDDVTITITTNALFKFGNTALEYNPAFKNLTIKSTAGTKIAGRITPLLANMESLTYDGLTFVAYPDGSAEGYTSINFPKQGSDTGDSIKVLTIKNCTFDGLQKEQIIAHRGNDFKQMIETIIFTKNTINNYGVETTDGGNHPFQINKGCTNNFVMTENVFNNWAGKQFLNFGNMSTIANSDSIINITVENNIFNGWGGYSINHVDSTNTVVKDGRNAHNFIEFSNNMSKGAKINVNNNLFYHNMVDSFISLYPVATLINFTKDMTDAYAANTEINVAGNLFIPDSVASVRASGPTYEETIALPTNTKDWTAKFKVFNRQNYFQKDFPEFAYKAGDKMLQSNKMYTAGHNNGYIGTAEMYYDFKATETGAVVSTAAALKQALAYDFGEYPVITLLDCTDEGGIYKIGTGYQTLNEKAKGVTIKAAEGAKPVVCGTLAATKFRLEYYTIDGLTFVEGGVPVQMMLGNDTINTLTVTNCVFDAIASTQIAQFRAGNGYLGKFIFKNNEVLEYGMAIQDGGNHAFQFNQKNFTVGSLEFTDNQFIEYGGKQFINFSNVGPVVGSDSIMRIKFNNNTMYGFSGNGWWSKTTQYRNFLEFTCGSKYGWKGAEIEINNNLFFELNHKCDSLGIANRLALGTDGTNDNYKVRILNNVFYPDSVMAQVELGKVMENGNLPIFDNANITATRNDITLASLGFTNGADIWYQGNVLQIPHTSPLMKAGVDGTYIGAAANYVKDVTNIPHVAYFTTDKAMDAGAAATTEDPIYKYLNEGYDYNVELVVLPSDKKADVSALVDLSKFDAAIIAEQLSGDAAALMTTGPLAISKLTVPTIYNKAFAFKAKRALAQGTATGSASGKDANVASIVVPKDNQKWGLFEGIDFSASDTVVIFNALATDGGTLGDAKSLKGISYISGLDALKASRLAYPAIEDASVVSASFNYVPAGAAIGSETTVAPIFLFGMNSGAIAADNGKNITEAGLKLWKNALDILLGTIDEQPRNLEGLPKLAYVTKNVADMAEGAADPVLAALKQDASINVIEVISDGTAADVAGVNAILIQESMGGGDKVLTPTGALALSELSVPTIYNKSYAFKKGRAITDVAVAGNASGKEAGATVLSITPLVNSNLFDSIDTTAGITLFNGTASDKAADGDKALNYVAGLKNTGVALATPTGIDAALAFNYIKAGEMLGDATLKADVLTFGMNYGALCKPGNITDANLQLWKNAVDIVMGKKAITHEAIVGLNNIEVINSVFANNGVIYINASEAAEVNIYNMTGSLVKSVSVKEGLNSIDGMNAGQMYLVRCNDQVSKVIL